MSELHLCDYGRCSVDSCPNNVEAEREALRQEYRPGDHLHQTHADPALDTDPPSCVVCGIPAPTAPTPEDIGVTLVEVTPDGVTSQDLGTLAELLDLLDLLDTIDAMFGPFECALEDPSRCLVHGGRSKS